jgi:hypothetical protein
MGFEPAWGGLQGAMTRRAAVISPKTHQPRANFTRG